jgi:hypothetical protein
MGRVMFPHSRPPQSVVRLVVTQAALGAALGFLFACALCLFDTQGIGTLIRNSDSGALAFILLCGGFMITGGSVVAGTAIMALGSRDDDDDHGGHSVRLWFDHAPLRMVPVRVQRQRPTVQQRDH